MRLSESAWSYLNFLDLSPDQSSLKNSSIVLIPVPYDSTTSYMSGARDGPLAIIRASYNLEDYDHELGKDIASIGIHTTPFLEPVMEGPWFMMERVERAVAQFVSREKIIGLLGGEHSISIGAVRAMSRTYSNLSVLYLDAHGDLRDEYQGTKWGHASVARRISAICPLTHVGIRSISQEEVDFIKEEGIPAYYLGTTSPELPPLDRVISGLSENVYISIDLDCLDTAIMPAVGTPEPGGLSWAQITALLQYVSEKRRVVGFDVVELSPGLGPPSSASVAAKLVYKLIAYATGKKPAR